MQQQPQMPPQHHKKSRVGCWIALAVVVLIVLIGVVAVGLVIYAASQNEDIRRVTRVMGAGMRMVAEAQSAPGTGQIRAIGCDQAMVFDMSRLREVIEEADGRPSSPEPDDPLRIVVCQTLTAGGGPTCEHVARTYLQAAPSQPGMFAVIVQSSSTPGQGGTQCSMLFDERGNLMGEYNQASGPAIPQAPSP